MPFGFCTPSKLLPHKVNFKLIFMYYFTFSNLHFDLNDFCGNYPLTNHYNQLQKYAANIKFRILQHIKDQMCTTVETMWF